MDSKLLFGLGFVAAFSAESICAQDEGGAARPAEPELVPLPVEKLDRTEPVDFGREIFPILKKNCIACHSESKAKAKLVLETPDAIRKGSENGAVVKAGDPANSVLFLNAAHMEEPAMPPEKNKANAKNLTPRELALVKLWIDQGAKGEGPVKTEKPLVWRPLPGGVRPVYAVSLSPDGRYLAAGRGNGIEVFEVSGGERVAELRDGKVEGGGAHLDLVGSISHGDGWIASGGFREVKLWKKVPAAVKQEIALGAEVVRMAMSVDGMMRGAALKNGDVVWWAKGKAGEKKTVKVEGGVTALAVDKDGKVAVGTADKKLRVFGSGGGAAAFEIEVAAEVADLVFCQDGRVAGVLAGDPVVRVWKTEDAAAAPQELKGHGKPVRMLGSGGAVLASAAEGGEVKIWKLPAGGAGPTLKAGGEVTSLATDGGGVHVAMSVADGSVKVFATADGKAVAVPATTAESEYRAKFAERHLNVSRGLANTRKTQRDAALKKRDDESKKVQPAKDALVKAEAEKKAKEEAEKGPNAQLEKAKTALAAGEAKAVNDLKPLQDQVAKAEEAAKTAPEKAKASADVELAKAREALVAAEAKVKNDLKPAQDEVAKAEGAAAKAPGEAKAAADAEVVKAKAELAAAEAKGQGELKPLQERVAKAEAEAGTAPGKAKASADAEVAKAKAALAAAEVKVKGALKPMQDQLSKAEAEAGTAANKAKAAADAEVVKAKAALAAAEAKGQGELKPLQERVAKAEAEAGTAPGKAKASADAEVAKAKAALAAAEVKVKGALKPMQDQLSKAEAEAGTAANKAKAAADAEVVKAKAALAAAEAKGQNELKPLQDQAKKAEEAAKTAADRAKKAADAEIAKAKSALVAAENKGKNDLKPLQDQLKKAEDAANKAKGEADAARRAERGARFNVESAVRIAAREEEALKLAEEKLKAAEAAAKEAEAKNAEAKKATSAPAGKVKMVGFGGGRLVMIAEDGKIREWRPGGGGSDELGSFAGATAVAGGGEAVLLGKGSGEVSVLGVLPKWELAKVLETGGDRVTSVDFSPDGKLVAVGTGEPSRSGTLSVWNRDTGQKVWEIEDAHSDVVAALEFSPDGKFIATCAADRIAKVFEAVTGKFVRAYEGHTGYVAGVAWRADGLQFATASADHNIKVWEFETGDQKKTQKGHSKEVTAVCFLGTGDNLVTGSGDGSVRIANAPLPSSSGFVQCVAVDEAGKWIVSGGPDGVLRIWSAGDRKLRHVLK